MAMLAALVLAGCGDDPRRTYAAEIDEPAYRQGQALLKSGRRQEALAAFLNVIERRSDAPESHLEAGLLYLHHLNDPLAAIYHFKKYLALRPNSQQSSVVRQRIDFAIREFAKTLPAQPLPSQFERIDLLAKVDRLTRENEDLKQQLADLKAGRIDVPSSVAAAPSDPPASRPTGQFEIASGPVPTVRTRPPTTRANPPPESVRNPPAVASNPQTKAGTAPLPSRGPRSHVVQQGDTLYKLAQQYYGDRARWRDIFAANRNVMQTETDLKIGMTLRIP
jgi:LysM repeat protein